MSTFIMDDEYIFYEIYEVDCEFHASLCPSLKFNLKI